MPSPDLNSRIAATAFAFRGYNQTNLGRTAELLAHDRFGPIMRDYLTQAAATCSDVIGRPVDLVARVESGEETSLDTYPEAVALIVAVEQAQMACLHEFFAVDFEKARLAYGYSLGEISALVAARVLTMDGALRIPLALSEDCVALSEGVTLAVLFSRRETLPMHDVNRLCLQINQAGRGVIGISAYLAPNSVLMLGEGDTLDRFKRMMKDDIDPSAHLRKNDGQWPPLHTPILWPRCIPNRAAMMMHTMPGGMTEPSPPILSLVTGQTSYNDYNAREIIHRWVDHPQRLWDAVYETLDRGVERVVHVGPEPNIIPATFKRLADNVDTQTRGRLGMRTLKAIVPHPWLRRILRDRAALLRAPLVEQVILEDWLLEQD